MKNFTKYILLGLCAFAFTGGVAFSQDITDGPEIFASKKSPPSFVATETIYAVCETKAISQGEYCFSFEPAKVIVIEQSPILNTEAIFVHEDYWRLKLFKLNASNNSLNNKFKIDPVKNINPSLYAISTVHTVLEIAKLIYVNRAECNKQVHISKKKPFFGVAFFI